MVPEPSIVVANQTITIEAEAPAQEAAPAAQPTPEQVRAIEQVFTQDSQAHFAFGLMGMWTSTLLLRDLANEHFSRDEEEEEKRQTKPAE